MEPRVLHTRLKALAAGVIIAACAVSATAALAPAQGEVREGIDYGYVYSGAKSSSTAFVEAAMDAESLLVLGSSELSTPRKLVPQVPSEVFGANDWGVHPMLIGEAFDQSLWHAIALGAYDSAGIPRNKAVLIVTPGWFSDGGQDPETFKTRFSYTLYRQFCENGQIPADAKAYVRARLAAQGIDQTELDAASPALPQDHLNGVALGLLDDLRLRRSLIEVRQGGIERAGKADSAAPDFGKMRTEALASASEMSTNNDWGLEDAFYADQLEPVMADIEGYRGDETYSDTPEYDDLDCLLGVADACGIDLLIVLAPEHGPYYDYIGIDKATRQQCYQRVRDLVAAHSAQIADFSDREYEKYFLYDIVHFGWTGWVDVEQSMYEFAQDGA